MILNSRSSVRVQGFCFTRLKGCQTLKSNLKLKRVGKLGWVVEHANVGDVDDTHLTGQTGIYMLKFKNDEKEL